MCSKYFEKTATKGTDYSPPITPGLEEEGSETNAVLTQYEETIKCCFDYFAGGDDNIDSVEFMRACQKIDIINASTSLNRVLEIFVRCNQDELGEYFQAMPNPHEIRQMNLEHEEFISAVAAIAWYQPDKKKGDPFHKKLDALIEKRFVAAENKIKQGVMNQ